jgi:rhamnulokinase
VKSPVLSEKALALNFTNEGGACGTYRLLKNIMGLWLLQEIKREWERKGKAVSWQQMTQLSAQALAFRSLIDPDDPRFLAPGDMPARIRDFCRERKQPIPESDGALLRCVTESLALKYRWVLERLEELTGNRIDAFHMVGGGIQNELLCQWTANAIGRRVQAGPVEATALGNISVQMIAAGQARSLQDTRAINSRSFASKIYDPAETAAWNDAYGTFMPLLAQ